MGKFTFFYNIILEGKMPQQRCDKCGEMVDCNNLHRHIPLADLRQNNSISRYKKKRLLDEFCGFFCFNCRNEGEKRFGKDFFITEKEYNERKDYLESIKNMHFTW